MAVEAQLRPGEEGWKGAFDNLSQRFVQFDSAVVINALRTNDGHAGKAAAALRKLPLPAEGDATKAPEAAVTKAATPAKAAATTKAYAPKTAPQVPPPSQAIAQAPTVKAAVPIAKAAAPEPEVMATEALPPPDSKLIFVAALSGDIQQLEQLIAAKADLNARYTGRPNKEHDDKIIDATPLHLVVTMGKSNVAEILLRHGADIETKMRRGLGPGKIPEDCYAEMTPLHLAAMEGHTNIVEMLLARGANTAAKMQNTQRSFDEIVLERSMTPLEIAREMVAKGHSRDSVIALLTRPV